MFFRNGYNYDRNKISYETGLKCEDKSKTQQNQKADSDINTIVKRFGLTGQLPTNVRMPQYGDFTEITDYQTALNAVISAKNEFAKMPAEIRKRFNNNPQEFVEFFSDENNRDEAVKLGLVKKKEGLPPEGGVPPTVEGSKPVKVDSDK